MPKVHEVLSKCREIADESVSCLSRPEVLAAATAVKNQILQLEEDMKHEPFGGVVLGFMYLGELKYRLECVKNGVGLP